MIRDPPQQQQQQQQQPQPFGNRPHFDPNMPMDPRLQRRFGAPLNDILQSPTQNPYSLALGVGQDPSPAHTVSPAHSTNQPPTPHNQNHQAGAGRHLPPPGEGSTSPKRRRLHLNPPLHAADPSSIVVADMQNESDALHILAMASDAGRGKGKGQQRRSRSPSKAASISRGPRPIKPLTEFPLIKLGIVREDQVVMLSEVFFRCHHHLYVSPAQGMADDSLWYPRLSYPGPQSKSRSLRRMSDICSLPSSSLRAETTCPCVTYTTSPGPSSE